MAFTTTSRHDLPGSDRVRLAIARGPCDLGRAQDGDQSLRSAGGVASDGAPWIVNISSGAGFVFRPTRVQQFFEAGFAHHYDVSPETPAALVTYLALGAADALSGRNLDVYVDVAQLVDRAAEIEEQDLYVLRERE